MCRMKLFCAVLLGVAMAASTVPAMAAEPPVPNFAETATQIDQALDAHCPPWTGVSGLVHARPGCLYGL